MYFIILRENSTKKKFKKFNDQSNYLIYYRLQSKLRVVDVHEAYFNTNSSRPQLGNMAACVFSLLEMTECDLPAVDRVLNTPLNCKE